MHRTAVLLVELRPRSRPTDVRFGGRLQPFIWLSGKRRLLARAFEGECAVEFESKLIVTNLLLLNIIAMKRGVSVVASQAPNGELLG